MYLFAPVGKQNMNLLIKALFCGATAGLKKKNLFTTAGS